MLSSWSFRTGAIASERQSRMSEPVLGHVDSVDDELEVESTYKPPPEKTIEEILEADKEDESLRKYKETLLGEAKAGGVVVGEWESRYSGFWGWKAFGR